MVMLTEQSYASAGVRRGRYVRQVEHEPVTVRVSDDGPVRVIAIDRPEARNAVDGPTAARLADAFRAFEADDSLAVAILTGTGGTFCAGADLKAVATERRNRVDIDMSADGPMGPSRMTFSR